jgi:hypothetical protein
VKPATLFLLLLSLGAILSANALTSASATISIGVCSSTCPVGSSESGPPPLFLESASGLSINYAGADASGSAPVQAIPQDTQSATLVGPAVFTTQVTDVGAIGGESAAQMTYYFEFAGPQESITVDFLGAAYAFGDVTNIGGEWGASSGVELNGVQIASACEQGVNNSFCGQQQLSNGEVFSYQTVLSSNTQYSIFLHSNALASPGSYANSGADPYIYLDPSTPLANQLTLELSGGIGNQASSIPEPSTVALIGVGLGILLWKRFVPR